MQKKDLHADSDNVLGRASLFYIVIIHRQIPSGLSTCILDDQKIKWLLYHKGHITAVFSVMRPLLS